VWCLLKLIAVENEVLELVLRLLHVLAFDMALRAGMFEERL